VLKRAEANAKSITLNGVSKSFGPIEAVRPLDLEVRRGEFLTLLGPSGCGKTTILRMIAGLEATSSGTIRLGETDVTSLPPRQRDMSIMFQDYALFPHMSIAENVAYGLKMRGAAPATRRGAALDWLERIGLGGLGARRPDALSGGQRQRVALARALITDPGALLLDETLSALDASLRTQLRGELRRIHREVGTTFLCVTHDQEEAMTLSDRVAVLRDGRVEQIGQPADLYDAPASAFVARFFGRCRLWPATVMQGGRCRVSAAGVTVTANGPIAPGQGVLLVARPERLRLAPSGTEGALNGTVDEVVIRGPVADVTVTLAGGLEALLELPRHGEALPAPGSAVAVIPTHTLAAVPAEES